MAADFENSRLKFGLHPSLLLQLLSSPVPDEDRVARNLVQGGCNARGDGPAAVDEAA